jgi:hypothetical protein
MRSLHLKSAEALILNLFILISALVLHTGIAKAQRLHEKDVIKAEELLASGELDQAITLYEKTLTVLINQRAHTKNDAELGKVHSRIGQLYIKKMRGEPRPEYSLEYRSRAAFHYIRCTQSNNISSMLKESICAPQVAQLTAPLRVVGEAYQINVVHPIFFRGPARDGQLLPKGLVSVEIKKKPNSASEQRLIRLPMENPLDFTERDYMPARPLLDDPTGLVIRPQLGDPTYEKFHAQNRKIPKIPGYIFASIGIISLMTPIIMEVSDFDNKMGDQGVRLLYLSGGISAGLGTGWLVWAW